MEKYRSGYVFLILVQFCYGAMQIYEVNENIEMQECVAMIIQRTELINETDVTLVNVNVSLAKKLHLLFERPVRFISRSFYWPNDTIYNYVYVIQCSNFFTFAHGLDMVRRDSFWNPRAKFVIIVENIGDFLQDISDFLIYNHIYDAALVVYSKDEDVVVYTFGLEHDECDRPVFNVLQVLAPCSELHSFDKIYVAARKTYLRGCHVKFVSHEYWPFKTFSEKQGIEDYLLKLIRQYENITVNVVNYGKLENFGGRLKNFTYTGMLHEIEIYNVEGAAGGYILTFNRMSNLDFIYPFMVDYHRIVIARAKLLNKWNAVLKQIGEITVWIIFGTFCVSCTIVILMEVFKKGQGDMTRDILIVWGYFLGNISQRCHSKSGTPYRMILLFILIYVFIISITIQASLLSVTTQPIRDHQPDTLNEVVSSYQLIVSPNQYSYLQSNAAVNLTNAKTICNLTLDCIMRVMTNANKRLFTVASDIYHQSHIWKFSDKYGELKIHRIKESHDTLLQTIYIRRGSSLAEPFNRLLLRARSGGLIEKFVEVLTYKEELKSKFNARRHNKPQSLRGIQGVFMVLISGYCISSILFLIEYSHYR